MLNKIILGDSLVSETWNHINCKNFIIDPPFEYYKNKFVMPEYKKAIVFTAPNRIKDTINCCGIPDYLLGWDCVSKNCIGKTRPLQQMKLCLLYGNMKDFDNRKMRTTKKVKYTYEKSPYSGIVTEVQNPYIYLSDLFNMPISKCKNYSKPLEWCTILVKNFIDNDFIDLFMGTGTFIKVAKILNVNSWHFDIDEVKINNVD